MGRAKQTPAEQAAAAVVAARGKLTDLEADRARAQVELEAQQERAGGVVLDDPSAAARLSREIRELRDRVDITDRAIEAQRAYVQAAEGAYLTAEADALEVATVTRARATLEAHQARTEELLGLLEEHECLYVPEQELIEARRQANATDAPTEWAVPRSELLADKVAEVEMSVAILRSMAEGSNPQPMLTQAASIASGRIGTKQPLELYPACAWGPEALVPAPAFLRTRASREGQLVDAGQAVEHCQAQVARFEAERAAAAERGDVAQLRMASHLESQTVTNKLYVAQQKLEKALARREELREQVIAYGGQVPEDSSSTTDTNSPQEAAANSSAQLASTA